MVLKEAAGESFLQRSRGVAVSASGRASRELECRGADRIPGQHRLCVGRHLPHPELQEATEACPVS